MNNELKTVQFRGATLFVVTIDFVHYVALKPICDALGLSWEPQLRRTKRHAVLRKGMAMMVIPSVGGAQETVVFRLKKLDGWLLGIQADRVKPEAREKLMQYQEECCEVLDSHFRGPAPQPKRVLHEAPAIGMRPRPLTRADQRIVNLHAQRLAHQAFELVREHIRLRIEDEIGQCGYACIEEIVDHTDLSDAVNN